MAFETVLQLSSAVTVGVEALIEKYELPKEEAYQFFTDTLHGELDTKQHMGEIADAMIGGEMCNMCGVYLAGEPTGFPSFCSKQCARDGGMPNGYIAGEIEI